MKRPQQPKEILRAETRQRSVHKPTPQQTSGRDRCALWLPAIVTRRRSGHLFILELRSEGPAGPQNQFDRLCGCWRKKSRGNARRVELNLTNRQEFHLESFI